MAKLKDNMLELDSEVQRVQNLPRPGLIEGPFRLSGMESTI